MTLWTVDQAFDEFKKQYPVISGAENSNEATTRLRAIDTVLFDVLKWDKLAVETEKYCRTEGFADYAFLRSGLVCLILEAKKSGKTFLLPSRKFTARPFGFGLLAKECSEAASAMTQAQGYAAIYGSRFVAISNGHQWLLALTFVQDQPLDERLIYVFESYEAILSRFPGFWDCFGPEGVYSNAVSGELLESRKAPAPPKLSAGIANYPKPADRNVICNELSYVLQVVWNQMEKGEGEAQFLRECYVVPEATPANIQLVKELLEHRRSADGRQSYQVLGTEGIADVVCTDLPERPIIVLGGVGHGKSTFLMYLRLIAARDILSNYIQLDINFVDRPDSRGEVGRYVYDEIDRQLLEHYGIDLTADSFVRGVLNLQLDRFSKSATGQAYKDDRVGYKTHEIRFIEECQRDRHNYLTCVFRHLRLGRSQSIALFLDNLDRRDDHIQEEAFLLASAMARDWACLVFVCLRPDTFYLSRSQGVLDSVAPKVITVASPPSSPILKRRFRYASQMAKGTLADGQSPPWDGVVKQLLFCKFLF
jgi:hypothetical protein